MCTLLLKMDSIENPLNVLDFRQGKFLNETEKKRGPVSQKLWHDKDPFLGKGHTCRVKAKQPKQSLTANGDVSMLNEECSSGALNNNSQST